MRPKSWMPKPSRLASGRDILSRPGTIVRGGGNRPSKSRRKDARSRAISRSPGAFTTRHGHLGMQRPASIYPKASGGFARRPKRSRPDGARHIGTEAFRVPSDVLLIALGGRSKMVARKNEQGFRFRRSCAEFLRPVLTRGLSLVDGR